VLIKSNVRETADIPLACQLEHVKERATKVYQCGLTTARCYRKEAMAIVFREFLGKYVRYA